MAQNGQKARAVETRWLVIAEDGRHATLGRHSDPTADELAAAGSAMDKENLAAWLVLARGDFWNSRQVPELLVDRRLTVKDADVNGALESWRNLYAGRVAS